MCCVRAGIASPGYEKSSISAVDDRMKIRNKSRVLTPKPLDPAPCIHLSRPGNDILLALSSNSSALRVNRKTDGSSGPSPRVHTRTHLPPRPQASRVLQVSSPSPVNATLPPAQFHFLGFGFDFELDFIGSLTALTSSAGAANVYACTGKNCRRTLFCEDNYVGSAWLPLVL